MRQSSLKKFTLDLGSMEKEVERRLRQENTKLFIHLSLCFILTAAIIFFVI